MTPVAADLLEISFACASVGDRLDVDPIADPDVAFRDSLRRLISGGAEVRGGGRGLRELAERTDAGATLGVAVAAVRLPVALSGRRVRGGAERFDSARGGLRRPLLGGSAASATERDSLDPGQLSDERDAGRRIRRATGAALETKRARRRTRDWPARARGKCYASVTFGCGARPPARPKSASPRAPSLPSSSRLGFQPPAQCGPSPPVRYTVGAVRRARSSTARTARSSAAASTEHRAVADGGVGAPAEQIQACGRPARERRRADVARAAVERGGDQPWPRRMINPPRCRPDASTASNVTAVPAPITHAASGRRVMRREHARSSDRRRDARDSRTRSARRTALPAWRRTRARRAKRARVSSASASRTPSPATFATITRSSVRQRRRERCERASRRRRDARRGRSSADGRPRRAPT